MPTVPKGVPLSRSTFVTSLVDEAGKKVAAGRKTPSADVQEVAELVDAYAAKHAQAGKPVSAERKMQALSDHVAEIYKHNKLRSGGPGPYPVEGFRAGPETQPSPATVYRTTNGQILTDNIYGDQFENMRDAISQGKDTGHPMDLSRALLGGHRDAWDRPVHVFTGQGEIGKGEPKPGFSWGTGGLIYINDQHPVTQFYHPQNVMSHEARHGGSHSMGRPHEARHGGKISEQEAMEIARKRGIPEQHQEGYARRLLHGNRMAEMEAHYGDLKGLHYGLTGELIRTPEDNVRFLGGILSRKHKPKPFNGNQTFQFFEDDTPIMQYGPRAGQPAMRKNDLEAILQDLYPRGNQEAKGVLFNNYNKMMSTGKPNEAPHV